MTKNNLVRCMYCKDVVIVSGVIFQDLGRRGKNKERGSEGRLGQEKKWETVRTSWQ